MIPKDKKIKLLEYSPSNGTLIFGNNIKSKMEILNLIRKK